MALVYKEDWEEAKQRMCAWWAGENTGRCGLGVIAPRKGAAEVPPPPRPDTPQARWYDLDYALCRWEHARTFYGGEAFPVWCGGYPGHTTQASFLGCRVDLDFDTGWVRPHPSLAGEGIDCKDLTIDETGKDFQFQLALLGRGAEEAGGKSIPGVGAFGGVGDTLAWLRGTERLLYDVLDRPDEVRAAEVHLMDQWCELYDRFYAITREAAEGSTCWFGLWSPGKFYATQNDFAYMISPATFEELFLPALRKQLEFLDHAIHHVDGVGNFAHVDLLCELPKLNGLQILPGAGKPSPLHYMPVLKKVQAAGKNLHIGIAAKEVEAALSELSARGLFISTSCESEEDARDLLRKAEHWSGDAGKQSHS
ncbi:MAG: hypothetical protein GWP05_01060 [Anaerolineaceae bacterium]|nr:hypothetical protein [Anaerolineaceae bacterium]